MVRTIQLTLQARIQAILLARYGTTPAQIGAAQLAVEQPPTIALGDLALPVAFELAQRMAKELCNESEPLDHPEAVVRLLRARNLLKNVETLQVLSLNTRRRFIRLDEITDGTLDTLLVHPREVFRKAIAANAAAVVLAHNHPSGDPTPSEADIKVTRDLIRAGQLLKIEVLDHVIIGRATPEQPKDYVSLRELGYFYS